MLQTAAAGADPGDNRGQQVICLAVLRVAIDGAGAKPVFSNSGMSLERTAVDVAKRVDLVIGDSV
ncbi:MAG: hypothetical protein ACK540_03505, partial [Betaproteobacteria bacterium]